jgi:hypothetical protein
MDDRNVAGDLRKEIIIPNMGPPTVHLWIRKRRAETPPSTSSELTIQNSIAILGLHCH